MARLLIVEDSQELAALLTAASRKRGHAGLAVHSGEDALRQLTRGGFDAAIVDLLLPGIGGHQVLRALKDRQIPAIAISGVYRGARFVREATEVHGARAFFEKPFDVQALLGALDGILGASPAAPAGDGEVLVADGDFTSIEDDDLVLLEEGEPAAEEPMPFEPDRTRPAPAQLEGDDELALFERAFDALGEPGLGEPLPDPAPSELDPLARALSEEESRGEADPAPKDRAELAPDPAIPRLEQQPSGPPPLQRRTVQLWSDSGRLTAGAVARLLTACHQARYSGRLTLTRGEVLLTLALHGGRVAAVTPNRPEDGFAHFCQQRGRLTAEDLEAVAQICESLAIDVPDALVRLELVTAQERAQLVEAHMAQLLAPTFAWSDGEHSFGEAPEAPAAEVAVFTGTLVLEGLRASAQVEALRERMAPGRMLSPSIDPPYDLWDFALDDARAALLAMADGTKSVADLLTLCELEEREALALLVGLEELDILEERSEPPSRRRISYGV